MKSFFKSALKWALILGGLYTASLVFSGLEFETRVGWAIAGLALSIAYVDGTQKDRMSDLEIRIDALERHSDGPPRY